MLKISACVITKNEEKNIARSILSYKDIVDEIIVVDSESTDGTVEIAKSLGAKVYTRPWTNDFAAAKNYAIDRADGDWILFLDADEYLREGCAGLLREVVGQADRTGHDHILVPEYQLDNGKNIWHGRTFLPRILKNDGEVRYKNAVHEYPARQSGELKPYVTQQLTVHHTGYCDPERLMQKNRRNLEILLANEEQHPDFLRLSYLAEAYYSLGELEKCLDAAERLLALPDFEEALYGDQKVFRAYRFKTEIMLRHPDQYAEKEIAKLVQKAVDDFGKHPEIRAAEAGYYTAYNKIDQAIGAMQEAFKLDAEYQALYENGFSGASGCHCKMLAELFMFKGMWDKATEYTITSLQADRYDQDRLFDLLCMIKPQDIESKQGILESLYATGQPDDLNHIITAAWLSGSNDVFSAYFLKLLKEWPQQGMSDSMLLCKIFYLQKKYADVRQIAELHPGEDFYERYRFIADRSMGVKAKAPDTSFMIAALVEMLQAGEDEAAMAFIEDELVQNEKPVAGIAGKLAIASVLKKYFKWKEASDIYFDVARKQTEDRQKGRAYYLAAHMSYLAGDTQIAAEILREALPYALPGDHLAAEILGWIEEKTGQADANLYQRVKELKAKYEAAYNATTDRPLETPVSK